MGIWLQPIDVVRAVSLQTVIATCDDNNVGTYDIAVVNELIEEGEQELLSYLVGEYGPPPIPDVVMAQLAADRFLRSCALEYVKAQLFDRHPEAVRSTKERSDRFKRVDERLVRVLDARQRPTSVPTKPANVGGTENDGGPRLYADNSDGSKNSGDY
jgi:hypothetical protein